MDNKNAIGLPTTEAQQLCEQLNKLLASYQVYFQNMRGLHWNIRGDAFFTLHEKFEELYGDAYMKVDELAERILTLSQKPVHTYANSLKQSAIEENERVTGGNEAVQLTLDNLRQLLIQEREALETAQKLGDEGSITMLSDFITSQEKTVWMLSAYLG